MNITVVTFPGSNCDKDVGSVFESSFKAKVRYLWHRDRFDDMPDLVVLPGGFSYGDYLRCGAMAKFSPAMDAISAYIEKGGWVLGICNGFQILTEAGLLPGALLPNRTLKYICRDVELLPNPSHSVVGKIGKKLEIPIAHGDGAYFAPEEELKKLAGNNQILFQYTKNPNGSLQDIAGISNQTGRVLGMMPHPERAMNPFVKKEDGKLIFSALLSKI